MSPCPHRLLQPTGGFCSPCLCILIACYNLQVVFVRRVSMSSSLATTFNWFLFTVSLCPHCLLQPASSFSSRCLRVLIACCSLQVVSVRCVSVSSSLATTYKWFLFAVSPCPHRLLQPTGGFCSPYLCILIPCHSLLVFSVCRVFMSSSLATTYRWFLFAVFLYPHPMPQSIGGFCLPCLHVLIARCNLQVASVCRVFMSLSLATTYKWFLFNVSVRITSHNPQAVSVHCVCITRTTSVLSGWFVFCLFSSHHNPENMT